MGKHRCTQILLGEYTFLSVASPFRDLGQIEFSSSEFAAAEITDRRDYTLAKDPLGFKSGPYRFLKQSRNDFVLQ